MTEDALSTLVHRAMTDREFMKEAQSDLEGTLKTQGIKLTPEELEAVRAFFKQTLGVAPEEAQKKLAGALVDSVRREGPVP